MTDIQVSPEGANHLDGTVALAAVTVRFDSAHVDLTEREARELHRKLTAALRWIDSQLSLTDDELNYPPRIEDMAPGTTFWAQHERSDVPVLFVKFPKWVAYARNPGYVERRIDPSTIRGVTPPQ